MIRLALVRERGTALIEILIVGCAVVLLVLPVMSMAARLTEANGAVHGAAQNAAVWVARHGDAPPTPDGIHVEVTTGSESVSVVATQHVVLVSIGGSEVSHTVQSRVIVPVSAFRSAR